MTMTKMEKRRTEAYHNGEKTVVVGVRMTLAERDALDAKIENSNMFENRSEAFRYALEMQILRKR
jgi:Arc/MetJ-type ribon-helix-helix transcriptional regulator